MSLNESKLIHSNPVNNLVEISFVWQPYRVFNLWSGPFMHRSALYCCHTHLWWLTWKYGGQHTNNLHSTPAHYGNNYCRNQSAKLQSDTEALLSERKKTTTSFAASKEHRFGLDPCAPWTPPLASPPLITSCLQYRDVEVMRCKGQGLGVMLSLRRAPKIGVVWF